MASAPPAAAVTTAAAFVPMATSSNLFEIESSRIALQRSRNQSSCAVRPLNQRVGEASSSTR